MTGTANRFGPRVTPDATEFRLWAPKADPIRLEMDGVDVGDMQRDVDGWHRLSAIAPGGTRYRFILPDGLAVPDPASRYQPDDVHGPSEVIDLPAPPPWEGRAWHTTVLYEMHIGTFTPEGTFAAATARLPDLAALGVTALEIMPVAAFPGDRNWGYDGVALYAPAACYGRPEDLQALVAAAHAHGIAVLLDVVYNHFGPEGNYLPLYAPVFTEKHHTPWGPAVNYDDEGSAMVRAFAVENAVFWLETYGFDGLRLDAVHAIRDESTDHLLAAIAREVRERVTDRPIHLILENEENATHWIGESGGYTAQWNDDVHHGLHVAVTGEAEGYYADYHGRPELLARALAEGFAFQGEVMPYRGAERGEPSGHLPPTAFVAFLQNHDQIGNRAFGDRIHQGHDLAAIRAAAAAYLLGPQIPMIFQGEEWAASAPFQFFCDFGEDLNEAVREGRRAEFARFSAFADETLRSRIPDPTAPGTFQGSRLDWEERSRDHHHAMRGWYQDILALRHHRIVPLLPAITRGGRWTLSDDGLITVRWQAGEAELRLALNLSDRSCRWEGDGEGSELLWHEGPAPAADSLGPWSCRWILA
jgi:malto-oligosyltrehalose trehalohydrolase